MIIKIATCLLALSIFTSCETTQSTAKHDTLADRMLAQNSAGTAADPAPPSAGPEAVGEGPTEPDRNPALLPTPLLRQNAAAGL
jgi:hypothetical protein